jgi:hypothetical protein
MLSMFVVLFLLFVCFFLFCLFVVIVFCAKITAYMHKLCLSYHVNVFHSPHSSFYVTCSGRVGWTGAVCGESERLLQSGH